MKNIYSYMSVYFTRKKTIGPAFQTLYIKLGSDRVPYQSVRKLEKVQRQYGHSWSFSTKKQNVFVKLHTPIVLMLNHWVKVKK